VSDLLCGRLVDPDRGRLLGRGWRPADEPLRCCRVGGGEDALAFCVERLRLAVVDGGRGHQPDPGVPMLFVIPIEKPTAMSAGVVDRVEAVWEPWPVLQGLELGLAVGVVARGV